MENKENLPMTVAAFARKIGVPRQSLYKYIATKRLRAKKAGHLTVIEPAEAERFMGMIQRVECGDTVKSILPSRY